MSGKQLMLVGRLALDGFTLVEALVASVILALVVSGAAIAIISANRLLTQATGQTRTDALIEEDAAKLREAADKFTYCSGVSAYTIDGRTCNSSTPLQEDYYFPAASGGGNTAATTFSNACTSGTLADELTTLLKTTALDLSDEAKSKGISRLVEPENASQHSVRVTYTATGLAKNSRVLIIVPAAAAWCP